MELKWHNAETDPPKTNGQYLALSYFANQYLYRVLRYATDLYKVHDSDFYSKKGKAGWYDSDSEWGYYEHDGVKWWMELPEAPVVNKTNKE